MKPITYLSRIFGGAVVGAAIALTLPAQAANSPRATEVYPDHQRIAGLFHTIDVIEDVDDVLDGDFLDIDPLRDVTEGVEDVVDDVSDTYNDVTDIKIWEPFTGVDDTVEDFVDDVDDAMRHISNDLDDWFD